MIRKLLEKFAYLLIVLLVTLSISLAPYVTYAGALEITPAISNVVTGFSEKLCFSVAQGKTTEDATESVIREMVRGLIFSGALKEIMSVPQEDMTEILSTSVFNKCGTVIEPSKEQFNYYLLKLAKKGSAESELKPFKPFGLGWESWNNLYLYGLSFSV